MIRTRLATLFLMTTLSLFPGIALAEPLQVIALGDSLTAGYGLQPSHAYPAQLETELRAGGLDVRVQNAGLSGDTTAGGLARLPQILAKQKKVDLVIVALGANDMLRRLDTTQTEANLRAILQTLKDRNIPAYLVGMKAMLHMPFFYKRRFNAIYPDLADEFDVPLYPFFLEGVALNPKMNLEDGLHPSMRGVNLMAKNTAPMIREALQDAKSVSARR